MRPQKTIISPVLYFLFFLMFTQVVKTSWSCTVFKINSGTSVFVGKNLDWPIGDGFIVINKREMQKFALLPAGLKTKQWISRFGSVTFNQFGKEFPLSGMNEAGLIVEETSYPIPQYPVQNSKPQINELKWIQYQLDNYASVQEVLEHLDELNINKWLFGLHYFLSDASENCAIIEFTEGKLRIYNDKNLPTSVQSNNSYRNSLKYLKRFKGFAVTWK